MGKKLSPMAAKNGTESTLAIKQYTRALMPFSVGLALQSVRWPK